MASMHRVTRIAVLLLPRMRQWCRVTCVFLLLASGMLGQNHRAWAEEPKEPTDYLVPEAFVPRQSAAAFIPFAKKFLADHPNDPRTPRILQDIVMMGIALRDADAVRDARLQLLLEHPLSLQGVYLLKTTPAADLRKLLKERFVQFEPPIDRAIAGQIARAIDFCVREHGPTFADDDVWVIAGIGMGAPQVLDLCRQKIKDPQSNAARTLDIAKDPQLAARDRLLSLKPLASYGPARAFQHSIFVDQLDAAQRADEEVVTAIAEGHLTARQFRLALPLLLEACRSYRVPKLDYWLASCQIASNDMAAARATLKRLTAEFPQSTWSDSAVRLSKALDKLDDSLRDQHAASEHLLQHLAKSQPIRWSCVLELNGDQSGAATKIQIQLDVAQDSLEVVTTSAERVRLAYRANANGSRIYLDGEPTVLEFTSRGLMPLFTFPAAAPSTGWSGLGFSFNTVPQGSGALQQSMRNLVGLTYLNSAENRQTMLRQMIGSGAVPEPLIKEDGQITFRWLRPQVTQPELTIVELTCLEDFRLKSLRSGNWRVEQIEYGPPTRVEFRDLAWPDLPRETRPEMTAPDFFRLFAAISGMMSRKAN